MVDVVGNPAARRASGPAMGPAARRGRYHGGCKDDEGNPAAPAGGLQDGGAARADVWTQEPSRTHQQHNANNNLHWYI